MPKRPFQDVGEGGGGVVRERRWRVAGAGLGSISEIGEVQSSSERRNPRFPDETSACTRRAVSRIDARRGGVQE